MTEEEFRSQDQRQVPPSERQRIQREQDSQTKRNAQKQEDLMREDFALTFQTEHGRRVLAWMMERSGYAKSILSADRQGTVDPMATTFAAMELNFYLAMRRFIPIDVLQSVEYGQIKPSGTIEQTAPRKTSKDSSERT